MIDERLHQATELHRQGQLARAQSIYEGILESDPDHFEALNLLGVLAAQIQNHQRAVELIDRAIAIFPDHADTHFNRGLALLALGEWGAATAGFDRAIELRSDYAEAWFHRGNGLFELKLVDAAVASYDQAIAIRGDYGEAFFSRGVALHELKQWASAVASYDKATALRPAYVEAWSNRGNALLELGAIDAALASYDKAIAVSPDYGEAWYNRGNALEVLRQWDAALASYEWATGLSSDYAEAWSRRGNVLLELKRVDAALASYEKAIAIKPGFAEAWCNRGNALSDKKLWDAALTSYERAIAIKPAFPEAWFNLGNLHRDLRQLEQAAESFARAFSLNPDGDYFLGAYLYLAMMICDWSSFDELSNRMVVNIVNHQKAAAPVQALSIINSPSLLQQLALTYVNQNHPLRSGREDIHKRPRRDKIRVGYYSADFHSHASMYLVAEMFEKHDRSKFELIAFSFGPDLPEDAMRQRVFPAFDRFIDVNTASDEDVANLSRELEVDIAVDLKGFTKDSRTDIFAFRAAPIQVNYMGYPGSMGAGYMDYIIADHTLVPEGFQQFYTERIVYLPDSYQGNDSRRQIADTDFSRQELGLPVTGFVFCCFNNNYKITPSVFDIWMRLLERVEGAVLWLYEDNPQAAGNLRKEAVRRGVDAGRLVFARRMPLAEHLARHRLADLFLDTFPCNAHTTASDALWAGLPLLTRIGESFAGRVAASLLNAIGLPELITSSLEAYEALAIELATYPEKLAELRLKLEKNRLSTPLFDSERFTRSIEAAYEKMYERYHQDLPPAHIYLH
ncbi:MAG: tetratricopeptide repeat protein [Chlorobiaceae bacterium]|nr:tetratricopeptide repeat protein [Chlorobiaceae bacterium]